MRAFVSIASLMMIRRAVAGISDHGIAAGEREVGLHHFAHEIRERRARDPAELGLGLGRIAEQGVDFRGAEIAWIDRDDALAGLKDRKFKAPFFGSLRFELMPSSFPHACRATLWGGVLGLGDARGAFRSRTQTSCGWDLSVFVISRTSSDIDAALKSLRVVGGFTLTRPGPGSGSRSRA